MSEKLKIEVFKQPYTLVLHIQYPLDTIVAVLRFIREKNILLESMAYLDDGKHAALFVLHILVEKKCLKQHIELLTAMHGVVRVDDGENLPDENIVRILSPYLKNI